MKKQYVPVTYCSESGDIPDQWAFKEARRLKENFKIKENHGNSFKDYYRCQSIRNDWKVGRVLRYKSLKLFKSDRHKKYFKRNLLNLTNQIEIVRQFDLDELERKTCNSSKIFDYYDDERILNSNQSILSIESKPTYYVENSFGNLLGEAQNNINIKGKIKKVTLDSNSSVWKLHNKEWTYLPFDLWQEILKNISNVVVPYYGNYKYYCLLSSLSRYLNITFEFPYEITDKLEYNARNNPDLVLNLLKPKNIILPYSKITTEELHNFRDCKKVKNPDSELALSLFKTYFSIEDNKHCYYGFKWRRPILNNCCGYCRYTRSNLYCKYCNKLMFNHEGDLIYNFRLIVNQFKEEIYRCKKENKPLSSANYFNVNIE